MRGGVRGEENPDSSGQNVFADPKAGKYFISPRSIERRRNGLGAEPAVEREAWGAVSQVPTGLSRFLLRFKAKDPREGGLRQPSVDVFGAILNFEVLFGGSPDGPRRVPLRVATATEHPPSPERQGMG